MEAERLEETTPLSLLDRAVLLLAGLLVLPTTPLNLAQPSPSSSRSSSSPPSRFDFEQLSYRTRRLEGAYGNLEWFCEIGERPRLTLVRRAARDSTSFPRPTPFALRPSTKVRCCRDGQVLL